MERLQEAASRLEGWVLASLEVWAALSVSVQQRLLGAFVALPCSLVLLLATWLSPSPDGFGTHRQLGLAGCAVMTVTGWPCPMCGMTTTFALMAEGRLAEAVQNQPFGVVLFGMTLIGALAGWVDVIAAGGTLRGLLRVLAPYERWIAASLLIGLLGGWFWKMAFMHPEFFGRSF